MQPLATVTVTRAWHWGIVIVSDPDLGGQIPDVDPNARVTADANGLIVGVHHAQDIPNFEGDFGFAEVSVTVRHCPGPPGRDDGWTQVYEGLLGTPSGRLWIGDADDEVVLSGLTTSSMLRVQSPADDLDAPSNIRIDVWSA